MERTDALLGARSVCAGATAQVVDLLRGQPHLDAPLAGGSVWSVRDTAVHLVVGNNVYTEIAAGVPSPFPGLDPATIAATNAHLAADVAETDPAKLADLLAAASERFLTQTDGWPGEHDISFHAGVPMDLAALTTILAGDAVLHGYDIATALAAPWPIAESAALLVLGVYLPFLPGALNPNVAAGHSARYELAVRGGPSYVVRFADGDCALEEPGGPVDCRLSVDPVAYLLAFSGRSLPWPAFACGQFSVEGPRPELAAGFFDLFVFP